MNRIAKSPNHRGAFCESRGAAPRFARPCNRQRAGDALKSAHAPARLPRRRAVRRAAHQATLRALACLPVCQTGVSGVVPVWIVCARLGTRPGGVEPPPPPWPCGRASTPPRACSTRGTRGPACVRKHGRGQKKNKAPYAARARGARPGRREQVRTSSC